MSRRSEGAGNETLEVQAQNIAELLLAKKNIAQKQKTAEKY